MTYDKIEKLVTYMRDIETYTWAIYREKTSESYYGSDRIKDYEKGVKRAKQEILDLFQEK
tara:strand:+ start:534 stop:713 length:180 start_codon:yes stop_codon:yes gene_type:complete